jgi:hypothetical protein
MNLNRAEVSSRLLAERRDELLEELRTLAPELVEKLELTLDELSRCELDRLDN